MTFYIAFLFFVVVDRGQKTGRVILMKRASEETVSIEITFQFNNLKCVRMRPNFESSSNLKIMKSCY